MHHDVLAKYIDKLRSLKTQFVCGPDDDLFIRSKHAAVYVIKFSCA